MSSKSQPKTVVGGSHLSCDVHFVEPREQLDETFSVPAAREQRRLLVDQGVHQAVDVLEICRWIWPAFLVRGLGQSHLQVSIHKIVPKNWILVLLMIPSKKKWLILVSPRTSPIGERRGGELSFDCFAMIHLLWFHQSFRSFSVRIQKKKKRSYYCCIIKKENAF